MRAVFSILGLLLALGSAFALRYLGPKDELPRQAQEALVAGDAVRAVTLSKEALRRDPASAYRWADLGEAFYAAGDIPRARQCFARALELGPYILPVWVRDANFHYQLGEPGPVLVTSAHVLETVEDYDGVLFNYFDRLVPDPNQVLAKIRTNRRVLTAYFRHVIETSNVPAAEASWQCMVARRFTNDELTGLYVDFLLRKKLYDEAAHSWTDYVGPRRGDYPSRNLLFNGDFAYAPTSSPFDWRIQSSDSFDTVREKSTGRDGSWSVHITFHGDDNISYDNVIQVTRVHAGVHRFRAYLRTDSITTDQGIRFRIFDVENSGRLDYRTESITGTHDWAEINEQVTIPRDTNIVAIELFRIPSQKFENKIAGNAWVSQVSLVKTI